MQVWRRSRVGGVVGRPGKGVYGAEAHGRGLVAELADGAGEPFGVQTGGLAQGAVLVDAPAPVGPDQGAGPATTPKGSCQVERSLGSMRCSGFSPSAPSRCHPA